MALNMGLMSVLATRRVLVNQKTRLTAQRVTGKIKRKNGQGIRALNCFYTGGFSLALLKGGAAEVVSVDSSKKPWISRQGRTLSVMALNSTLCEICLRRCVYVPA